MKDINNIDELLRQSFEGFNPTPPPNAWQAIQQNLPTGNLVQPNIENVAVKTGNIIGKIKAISLGGKIAMVIGVAAIASGVFYLVEPNTKKIKVEPTVVENKAEVSQMPEQIILAEPTLPQEKNSVKPKVENKTALVKKSEPNTENAKSKNEEINLAGKTESNHDKKTVETTKPEIIVKEAIKESKREEKDVPLLLPQTKEDEAKNKKQEKPSVYNWISPNNDGINDYFEVAIKGETYFKLTILDLNGKVVFESLSADNKWNGLYLNKNAECPSGQYQYLLQYKYAGDEEIKNLTGFIQLTR